MDNSKESVVNLMLQVFNQLNRMASLQGGTSPEDTEKMIEQSQPSLNYILGMVYDKLDENNLLVDKARDNFGKQKIELIDVYNGNDIMVSLPKKIEGNDTDIIKMFFMTYRGYYEYYRNYKLEYIIKKQTALEKLFDGFNIVKNDDEFWELCNKLGYWGKWIEYIIPHVLEYQNNKNSLSGIHYEGHWHEKFPKTQ